MKKIFLSFLLFIPQVFGENLNINHAHLNELTGDNEAVFEPIAIKELEVEEESLLDGIRKRFVITYSKINRSDMDTSYNVSNDGDSLYDLYDEEFDRILDENLKFKEGHKVTIEYLVTQTFSIELADTYRRYNMSGRHVGVTEGGFLEDDQYDVYEAKNVTILNDIQIGMKYAIRLVDTPRFRFELSPGISAGLVHVQSDTKTYYNGKEYEENHFNDIGGYSYGVSLEAKAIFWDNFFVQVGVEQRDYVLAPMAHESGVSQQIDQSGFNFYIGAGIRF
ncbi:hypothetical protein ABMA70_02390 [Halobacteriovorax sp. XZX-3]|uniref:hypothetical protein n=1 Tax=unclassified Halobacteriovorax TaxID=2639665 RepID=UPI003711C990